MEIIILFFNPVLRILKALMENIENYEEKFGQIEE